MAILLVEQYLEFAERLADAYVDHGARARSWPAGATADLRANGPPTLRMTRLRREHRSATPSQGGRRCT